MDPYQLEFDDGGPSPKVKGFAKYEVIFHPFQFRLGWRWFLRDNRQRLVARSGWYSRKDAAKRAFEPFWQRLRKRPIISDKK
jgi:hypothetical protein